MQKTNAIGQDLDFKKNSVPNLTFCMPETNTSNPAPGNNLHEKAADPARVSAWCIIIFTTTFRFLFPRPAVRAKVPGEQPFLRAA